MLLTQTQYNSMIPTPNQMKIHTQNTPGPICGPTTVSLSPQTNALMTRFDAAIHAFKVESECIPSFYNQLRPAMGQPNFLAQALGLVDHRGYTPLMYAAAHCAPKFTQLLFESNFFFHPHLTEAERVSLVDRREPKLGQTALHFAVLHHSYEVAELLLAQHASVSLVDFEGCSPLHLATQLDDLRMVTLLLAAGASPNQPEAEYGGTALHQAAANGNVEMIHLLLLHGASLWTKDHDGEPPLFWAVREGHTDAVSVLIQHGCDPTTLLNSDSESVFDLCQQLGDLALLDSLQSVAVGNLHACVCSTTSLFYM